MEILTAVLIGGGVVGVSAASAAASIGSSASAPGANGGKSAVGAPGVFVWPTPALADGRIPRVSSGYGEDRVATVVQDAHIHQGSDIMFRRVKEATKAQYTADHGSKWYEVPKSWPVIACGDGVVWSVTKSKLGIRIVIDHGKNGYIATIYQHCEELDARTVKGAHVVKGQRLASVGHGEIGSIRHIHFEITETVDGKSKHVDPETHLKRWTVLPLSAVV